MAVSAETPTKKKPIPNGRVRTPIPVAALVRREVEAYGIATCSDLEVDRVEVRGEQEMKSQAEAMFVKALLEQELRGNVNFFTAKSRTTPVGLPIEDGFEFAVYESATASDCVDAVSREARAAAIEDKLRAAVESAHAEAEKRPIKLGVHKKTKDRRDTDDGIVLATSARIREWRENGLLPKPNIDHRSSFTTEDEQYIRRSADRFMHEYVRTLIHTVGLLKEKGLKPWQLTDSSEPIRVIDGRLMISIQQFVDDGYANLRTGILKDRDGAICQAPNMNLMNGNKSKFSPTGEIPICGRNLMGFYGYRVGSGPQRVDHTGIPGAELNHIFTRGEGTKLLAICFMKGFLTMDDLRSPERLMLLASMHDFHAMAMDPRGDPIPTDKAELVLTLAKIIPLINMYINSYWNLLSMEDAHHRRINHPDGGNKGIISLVHGVNINAIKPPPLSSPTYVGWCAEMEKEINGGGLVGPLPEKEDDARKLLAQVQRCVVLGGHSPANSESKMAQIQIANRNTQAWVARSVAAERAEIQAHMSLMAGERGAHYDQLSEARGLVDGYYSPDMERRIREETHLPVSYAIALTTLGEMGLASKLEAWLETQPVEFGGKVA